MSFSFVRAFMVSLILTLSTAFTLMWATSASAHEVLPAIADMERDGDTLVFDIRLNAESFIAGIDLTETSDTNDAPEAADYDVLRAMSAEELNAAFTAFWPEMAARIVIEVDGARVTPALRSFAAGEVGNTDLLRTSNLSFVAQLPEGATKVVTGWDRAFGTLVIRQMGVEAPYDGFLEAGALSDPITLAGGDQASGWQTFVNYIPVGFDHIVPKGLDHILFVLGLFFLSTKLRPLLTQVTLFTLAHTITLALAALGYTSGIESFFRNSLGIEFIAVVEPLIAASIAYVAIENIFMRGLSPWRPVIVFGFGLLHGLGFASVLGEFGLPEGAFIPGLLGFNIGVEVGQLAIIAVMFLCVWQAIRIDRGENEAVRGTVFYGVMMIASVALIWLNPAALEVALENPVWVFLAPMAAVFALCFGSVVLRDQVDAYRRIVSIPASVFIALVGIYWFIERVFL